MGKLGRVTSQNKNLKENISEENLIFEAEHIFTILKLIKLQPYYIHIVFSADGRFTALKCIQNYYIFLSSKRNMKKLQPDVV